MQYFFLNGRYIRDRSLQHAWASLSRLLLTGRYPIAFFTLHMPPELVDVNVHPTKLEVRFRIRPALQPVAFNAAEQVLTTDLNTRAQSMESNALAEPVAPAAKIQRRSRCGPGPADAAGAGRLGERQGGRLGRQNTGRASGTRHCRASRQWHPGEKTAEALFARSSAFGRHQTHAGTSHGIGGLTQPISSSIPKWKNFQNILPCRPCRFTIVTW